MLCFASLCFALLVLRCVVLCCVVLCCVVLCCVVLCCVVLCCVVLCCVVLCCVVLCCVSAFLSCFALPFCFLFLCFGLLNGSVFFVDQTLSRLSAGSRARRGDVRADAEGRSLRGSSEEDRRG